MSILNAFSNGFRRSGSEIKMALVIYVLNLLLAIPLALAFRSALAAGFGMSLAPEQLMQGLDFTVFQDFMRANGERLLTVINQMLSFLILSMLLQTFLAGGILSVLQDHERKFAASSFFKGCGMYFFRFFRLFLIVGVILLLVSLILGVILAAVVAAMGETSTSEVPDFWIRIAAIVLFLVPIILILMATDYAKIHIVLHDERSAFRACGKGFGFVFRKFFAAFGLELLLLLVPILLMVLYVLVDLAIGMTSGLTILLMFFIQQLVMAGRAWIKIFFYASEMALYRSLQRVPISEADIPLASAGAGKSVIV